MRIAICFLTCIWLYGFCLFCLLERLLSKFSGGRFSNRDYLSGCFLGGCATCFYMVYMSPEDECSCRFPDV